MIQKSVAALLAACLLAGCATPPGPPFPSGAQTHGPYLDRSFEGFVVRAAFVEDISVIIVQAVSDAPEASTEQILTARETLRGGAPTDVVGLLGLSPKPPATLDPALYEDTALKAAETPGWCPFETRFSYLDAIQTSREHPFKIRAGYLDEIRAFVFAGQCRPI